MLDSMSTFTKVTVCMYCHNKILPASLKKIVLPNNVSFRLGENQIKHLLKIAAFSKDKSLKEITQAEIKEQCLKLWKVIQFIVHVQNNIFLWVSTG